MRQQSRQPQSIDALPSLDELRGQINRIDIDLLDLVERRVSLSARIAMLKQADPMLKLRPRREAELIAGLTARAKAIEPELITHVWRTLMSCSLQTQVPMHLVLADNAGLDVHDRLAMQDRVRIRFGPVAALRWAADAPEALDAARTTETVAVIASSRPPDVDGDLTIFETITAGPLTAYAVGRIAPEDLVCSVSGQ